MRLVIVEDDLMVAAINREFALRTPELNDIKTFHNGREALNFLLKNDADLLMLDINMPRYTGLELLTDLRKQGKKFDAIIISGSDNALDVNEAFHLGIVDYLIKPFTYERFQEAVNKFLLQHSSLKTKEKFTQADIDKLMAKPVQQASESNSHFDLPKGIQQQTLDTLLEYMQENSGAYLTRDKVAADTGFSKMTVGRYMNYLIGTKTIVSRTNYSTGGRPSIEYIFTGR
ncbi:MAG: response regulator [Selenomonadaceae bacterium]|nr:response regulator [Selenomonadaceae bacterium]